MENSLPSSQDSSMRVALLVGHAKIASLEGKFVEAKLQFDKALKYAQVRYLPKLSVKDRDNLIAYIHYEYALYCQLVHAGELANSHFYHASALTKSAKMKLLIEFQFALIDLYQSSESDTGAYIQFIEKFHQNEMKVMEGIALMRLGNFYRDRKDYTESHKCYKSAMTIAEKEGYNYLRWNIQNSMGLLVSKESSQEAAIQYYTKSLESMESPYFKALMLKNLANRYYAIKKPNKTREILTEALEHCQINGISSQISILAEGIGDLYLEIDSSTSHAYQYYQIAFNEVISLANTGIPITGKRLRVVEKYSNLIQENLPEDFMALKEPGLFEWSKGKTWIQIKDLFHYNLFVYHFLHTGIGNVTFSQLKIHPGTFYSLSKRMRDLRGITIPDLKGVDFELPPSLFLDPLQKYAQLHRDKTWDQVNKQFEKDIYAYLFEESGYNKVRLAKMLDRSYAMVIKRTKHLTDVEKDQTTQTKA
ncbi:tetratricopeptide repeat protein [bacterium]|nr:tetratricopeptide repeat protein [bacterium]